MGQVGRKLCGTLEDEGEQEPYSKRKSHAIATWWIEFICTALTVKSLLYFLELHRWYESREVYRQKK